ncbi:MAG: hypothetical protein AAF192_08670 [Pseudomonadota bacterium]
MDAAWNTPRLGCDDTLSERARSAMSAGYMQMVGRLVELSARSLSAHPVLAAGGILEGPPSPTEMQDHPGIQGLVETLMMFEDVLGERPMPLEDPTVLALLDAGRITRVLRTTR